jgi:hypothetical protein
MTPGRLPNWESGPQNQPRAKVAVSIVPELCVSEDGKPIPASEPLGNRDILSPPLKETMLRTVINPNNTIRAKLHFIINDIPCQ